MPLRVACRELSLFVRCKSNKHVKSGSAFAVLECFTERTKRQINLFLERNKERLVF